MIESSQENNVQKKQSLLYVLKIKASKICVETTIIEFPVIQQKEFINAAVNVEGPNYRVFLLSKMIGFVFSWAKSTIPFKKMMKIKSTLFVWKPFEGKHLCEQRH